MREIKFEYIYSNWTDFIRKTFTLDGISNWDCYEFLDDMPLYKEYKIIARRQSTWLLDKNGKEIYEGDILAGHFNNWYTKEWCDTLRVVWYAEEEGSFKTQEIKPFKSILFERYMSDSLNKNDEIIWNIFENPNLLENE